MKKIILFFSCIITISTTAQIKVFQGGNTIIGDIETPSGGLKFQIVGNSTFTQSNSAITSSAFIRGNNNYSSAITPDYTWYNSDQTGIFHPASNTIGFGS